MEKYIIVLFFDYYLNINFILDYHEDIGGYSPNDNLVNHNK